MQLEIGKQYKIILKNNHVYRGRLLNQKDKSIDLFDFKYKDSVMISTEAIFEAIPMKDAGDNFEHKHY